MKQALLYHLRMRAIAALLPLLLLAGRGLAAAPADCAPTGDGAASAAVTIGRFDIVRHDIFDAGDESLAWPYRLANRLHPVTREGVIRRELLVGPGDCPDAEALAQTERNLRRLGFLRDAKVEVLSHEGGAPERVDVRVSTFDAWTTVPQLRFAKIGNRLVWTAGVSERNLFGHGQRIDVFKRSGLDRDEAVVALSDPRLAGSRVQALASFAARSDGRRTELEVGRPFFALTTRWSFRARHESFEQVDPVYEAGERVGDLPHAARWLELAGSRAVARTSRGALRVHVAYRHRHDDVAGEQRRFGIAEAGLTLVEHRFRKLTHVNRFESAEDFNLGHQLQAAVGASAPALGGGPGRALFVSVADRVGLPLGRDRFLLAEASWAGRRRGRWENAVGEVQLDGFARLARRAIALGRVQYRHGTNLDPEVQVTLGAQNGLRGYAVHQWVGTRSLLLAGEMRLFVADDVRQLASFGLAAFADAGYAWPAGRSVALRDLRGNVGIGLLVGRNRLTTSRRAARFDLAWAPGAAPGRSRWLFSAGLEAGFLN